jgi:hypothetical protein
MTMSKAEYERQMERLEEMEEEAEEASRDTGPRGGILVTGRAERDVVWFKPQARNLIDIIPFIAQADWIDKLRRADGKRLGRKPGQAIYKLEVPVHQRIGPETRDIFCLKEGLGLKCYVCEERSTLNWDEDRKEMEDLRAKWRVFYNVIDKRADNGDAILLWEVSYHLFEKEMLAEKKIESEERDDETISITHLEKGQSIRFRAPDKTIPGREGGTITFKEYKSFDFKPRTKKYKMSIMEEAHPLDLMVRIPTYEEGRALFLGVEEEERVEDPQLDDVPEEEGDLEPPDTEEEPEEEEPEEEEPEEEEPEEEEETLEDKLEDMGKKELLAYCREKKIRITGAKDLKPKKLRAAILEKVEETEPEVEEPEVEDEGKETCPSGFKFGVDCDEHDECDECEKWQECADKQDELKKAK